MSLISGLGGDSLGGGMGGDVLGTPTDPATGPNPPPGDGTPVAGPGGAEPAPAETSPPFVPIDRATILERMVADTAPGSGADQTTPINQST
jgi:hypothetical protein